MGGLPAATFPMQIRRSSYRTAKRNRAKGSAGRRAQGCWVFPGSDRWCKKSQPYIGQVKKTTSITGIPAPCSFPLPPSTDPFLSSFSLPIPSHIINYSGTSPPPPPPPPPPPHSLLASMQPSSLPPLPRLYNTSAKPFLLLSCSVPEN